MAGDGADAAAWRAVKSPGGFNAIFDNLRFRVDPDGRARCRVDTGPAQDNTNGAIHGGFFLALADQVVFIGAAALGRMPGHAVTLQAGVTFVGRGIVGLPVDALVEVTGETGRMVFVRGLFEQEGRTIGSFEAVLRKRSAAPAGA